MQVINERCRALVPLDDVQIIRLNGVPAIWETNGLCAVLPRTLRGRNNMNIIILLVVGGILSWLASIVMCTDGQQGIFLNVSLV